MVILLSAFSGTGQLSSLDVSFVSAFSIVAKGWPTCGQMSGLQTSQIASLMSDSRLVIAGRAFTAAASALALGITNPADFNTLLVWAFLYGASSITLYSVCIAHVNDRVSQRELLAAASGPLISYGLGSTFGPLLAGVAMDIFGRSMLFVGSAMMQGGFALFIAWRIILEQAVPEAEKERFVAMPSAATSHMGVEVNRHVEGAKET